MRTLVLTVLAGLAAGCAATTAYWDRPGATLSQVAGESRACYQAAVDDESPAAFARDTGSGPRLLPRSEPPPQLWKRAPRDAAFERFDEQLRYERCMRERGWVPAGSANVRRQ
jgi:hypothetical protein